MGLSGASILARIKDVDGLVDTLRQIDSVYSKELRRAVSASDLAYLLQRALLDGWTPADTRRWVRGGKTWTALHPGLVLANADEIPADAWPEQGKAEAEAEAEVGAKRAAKGAKKAAKGAKKAAKGAKAAKRASKGAKGAGK